MARNLERQLLADTALAVAAYAPYGPDWPICGFMACAGWKYDRNLMVLGRAVNGWGRGWEPAELTSVRAASEFAANVQKGVQEPIAGSGPMHWVAKQWGSDTDYNTARSAFWRVIREVRISLSAAEVEPTDWSDRLVWSNLYKLAPAAQGNPSETLCRLQFGGCLQLFRREIETFRPWNILLLSGSDWARPFVQATCEWQPAAGEIEATARYRHDDGFESRIVVAPHPQGRSEKTLANAVIEAFDE